MSGAPNERLVESNSPGPPPFPPLQGSNPEASDVTRRSQCAICLEGIEDRTTALDCGHTFCYECIHRWVQTHHQCPFCRQIIRFIRVQAVIDGGQLVMREEVVTPERHMVRMQRSINARIRENLAGMGYTMHYRERQYTAGSYTVVVSPADSAMYMVEPVRMGETLQYRYSVREWPPGIIQVIVTPPPGTLFVMPNALALVTAALQARGITQVEYDLHLRPNLAHSSLLAQHPRHSSAGQSPPPT